jgi:hypothetical protein
VAEPTVGTDFDQSANILVDLSPQVPFRDVFPIHNFPNAVHLSLAQLVHPWRYFRVQIDFHQYFQSDNRANAVDAAQRCVRPLTVWHVNASDTNHYQPPGSRRLTLPLGMSGVGANYADHTFPFDDPALVTPWFY